MSNFYDSHRKHGPLIMLWFGLTDIMSAFVRLKYVIKKIWTYLWGWPYEPFAYISDSKVNTLSIILNKILFFFLNVWIGKFRKINMLSMYNESTKPIGSGLIYRWNFIFICNEVIIYHYPFQFTSWHIFFLCGRIYFRFTSDLVLFHFLFCLFDIGRGYTNKVIGYHQFNHPMFE